MRFVALLRGVNVGGKNVIKMADLKRAFEGMGLEGVATVMASGNVLFSAPKGAYEPKIEKALSKQFGNEARVLVRSEPQLRRTVEQAPGDWPRSGTRCYVVFVKAPLTVGRLLRVAPPRPKVDTVTTGPGAVYYGTRMDARTRSGLQKLVTVPEYKLVTIRDFKTCSKILGRIEDGA